MNCFESRRLLLAAPRARSAEHEAHIEACPRCASLTAGLADLDLRIEKAAYVAAPEGLAHRILLARRPRPPWHYAAAAVIAFLSGVLVLTAAEVVHPPGFTRTAEAVGPTHPAVAAIAQVIDEDLPQSLSEEKGAGDVAHVLKRLGLALRKGEATAYYVGKCHVAGAGDCDHIVLSTRDAHVNVLLVPDYPLPARMLVSDRRMIALVNPSARGGYIVVADSVKVAKRMERFLKKG